MAGAEANHYTAEVDIKQISKRAYQLGIIAIITGCVIGCYYSSIGLVKSSYIDYGFSVGIALVLVCHYFKIIQKIQFYLILVVNLLLLATSWMEGAGTGQYLYFFPLMVAIPSIIDLRKVGRVNFVSYYIMSVVALVATMYMGYNTRPAEYINTETYHQIYLTNMSAAFVLTVLFSCIYIHFEYQYSRRLQEEQDKVIASRTRFLSTMGHELRTPLNGIIGAINILKEEARIDENDQYVQILKYCSDHMLKQVNDILDFNKIEAGKLDIRPVKVNLHQLVTNVAMPFANHFEQKGIQLKVETNLANNAWVMADDIRLVQIINNLLSNALKFTSRGRVSLRANTVQQLPGLYTVEFTVEDTGIGISKEDQGRIFDGFWQVYDPGTRYVNGTGLGLSICVRLLEMMHSKLNVESEKDEGSRFSFTISFKTYNEAVACDVPQKPVQQDNLNGLRILIVEDNPINMMIAKKTLTGLQATIGTALNGQEALDMLTVDARYDAILMDLEMPVLNGYDAIRTVKKLYPHIPTLAFTASLVDQQMLSSLLASGFIDVVLKPFQPHQLLSQLHKAIKPMPEPVVGTAKAIS